MSESDPARRYRSREDIRTVEISDSREEELRQAFAATVPGERIWECRAAIFDLDGEVSDSGVVVSSLLHHDRLFEMVGAFSGKPDSPTDIYAKATVKDRDSGENLAAHVSQEELLVSRKHEDVDFEAFRDYILFLENRLGVSLNYKT